MGNHAKVLLESMVGPVQESLTLFQWARIRRRKAGPTSKRTAKWSLPVASQKLDTMPILTKSIEAFNITIT